MARQTRADRSLVDSARDLALALAAARRLRRRSGPDHPDRRRRLRRPPAASRSQAVAPRQPRRDDARRRSTIGSRFAQYQAREEQLFAQVRALESTVDPADRTPVNRYHPGSLSHPLSAGRDWNRSFETTPATIRGGALLLHGLTDSPYSMRKVAEVLRDNGIYSLSLRMPGHGTVPSGLVTATWADWLAAVRMGVRHVRSRIPEGAPLVLVGYSNGGALALKYTLDALEGHGGPLPSKLILLSPMIGVSPAAGLAWWISRLGVVPYFEKANWLDVFPEYNPFKYNSFAANAGFQTGVLDAHHPERPRAGRGQRPARRDPADPHVSIDRRRDGEHAGGRAHALRSAPGEWQRAGALRRQSRLGHRGLHAAVGSLAGGRSPGTGAAPLSARRRQEHLGRHTRRRDADGRTWIVGRGAPAARIWPGRPRCSR